MESSVSTMKKISIHAPTRGATSSEYDTQYKRTIFQSTLLQEERHSMYNNMKSQIEISIHAPTRGATIRILLRSPLPHYFNPRSYKRSDLKIRGMIRNWNISIHAPTRGATLFSMAMARWIQNFNPRSYKRSDPELRSPSQEPHIFQSTLLQEERQSKDNART